MKRLLFIRHGATAGNLERRYIGATDEPLCAPGVAQIRELKKKNLRADQLFVSPMLRTRQTAEILFPQLPKQEVNDFRETDFGIFEGKNYQELSDSPEYQTWVDSDCTAPIPGGEQVSNFKKRCCEAFAGVMETVEMDGTAAFVVHGGTIMAILEAYAQPKQDFYHYHIKNGEAITCLWDNGVLRNIEKVPGI